MTKQSDQLSTRLEQALAARRAERRSWAVLALIASFGALTAVILPMPVSMLIYVIAAVALFGAITFAVRSRRAKRQAARVAAELHATDPYREILTGLPKPVAKAARDLLDVRSST